MPAGKITDVEGPARVQTSEGEVTDAHRGSSVNPGDRIITGRSSQVEVMDTEGQVTRITGKGTYEVPEKSSGGGASSGSGVTG